MRRSLVVSLSNRIGLWPSAVRYSFAYELLAVVCKRLSSVYAMVPALGCLHHASLDRRVALK